jgi:CBS domain-containing protein
MTLRDALSLMIERGTTRLPVEGGLVLDIADLPRRG